MPQIGHSGCLGHFGYLPFFIAHSPLFFSPMGKLCQNWSLACKECLEYFCLLQGRSTSDFCFCWMFCHRDFGKPSYSSNALSFLSSCVTISSYVLFSDWAILTNRFSFCGNLLYGKVSIMLCALSPNALSAPWFNSSKKVGSESNTKICHLCFYLRFRLEVLLPEFDQYVPQFHG